jgi:hypothetical protein
MYSNSSLSFFLFFVSTQYPEYPEYPLPFLHPKGRIPGQRSVDLLSQLMLLLYSYFTIFPSFRPESETILLLFPTGMQHPRYADLINRAAHALFTGAPSALLARELGVFYPKATARSWRQGHRRAPLSVLKTLLRRLQARGAECHSLCREFDIEIARREGEPPSKRRGPGFMEIRERDGPGSKPRDGRNRLGRPKKIRAPSEPANAGRGR